MYDRDRPFSVFRSVDGRPLLNQPQGWLPTIPRVYTDICSSNIYYYYKRLLLLFLLSLLLFLVFLFTRYFVILYRREAHARITRYRFYRNNMEWREGNFVFTEHAF